MEDMRAYVSSPDSKRENELEVCSKEPKQKKGLSNDPPKAWNSNEEKFQGVWKKTTQEHR